MFYIILQLKLDCLHHQLSIDIKIVFLSLCLHFLWHFFSFLAAILENGCPDHSNTSLLKVKLDCLHHQLSIDINIVFLSLCLHFLWHFFSFLAAILENGCPDHSNTSLLKVK